MTTPTPRHRRPPVADAQHTPAFVITPPGTHRHEQLVPVPSADTIPEDEHRTDEQEIERDRRSERFLLLKAFLALAVVGGIAVAHTLFLG